jgi:fatty-acyl-CoA synthase
LGKEDGFREGYVYIVDREKDMYISGGENVYPAEVEKVFFTHPKIFGVAIIGVPDEKWGEVGKAFIIPRPGEKLTSDEVFEFIKGIIAKYKVPKYLEFVKELPKTPSGKIQKNLLRNRNIGSINSGPSAEYRNSHRRPCRRISRKRFIHPREEK